MSCTKIQTYLYEGSKEEREFLNYIIRSHLTKEGGHAYANEKISRRSSTVMNFKYSLWKDLSVITKKQHGYLSQLSQRYKDMVHKTETSYQSTERL